jgi:hypothetical protein
VARWGVRWLRSHHVYAEEIVTLEQTEYLHAFVMALATAPIAGGIPGTHRNPPDMIHAYDRIPIDHDRFLMNNDSHGFLPSDLSNRFNHHFIVNQAVLSNLSPRSHFSRCSAQYSFRNFPISNHHLSPLRIVDMLSVHIGEKRCQK